ncbi:MAG: hypothetical protein AAGA36_04880 [Pseudomonadota bacterium]
MKKSFMALAAAFLSVILWGASEAQQTPRITLQSILNTLTYDSGLMAFQPLDIAFAPEKPLPMTLFIKNQAGETLGQFGSYNDFYVATDKVFARQKLVNTAQMTFKPGIYALQFAVGSQAATQFLFKVDVDEVSDDPFNPKTSYKFVGPWQQYAYLLFPTMRNFKTGEDPEVIELHFWAGKQDQPSTVKKGGIFGWIMKDDKLLAHSKRTQGYLDSRQLAPNRMLFYKPHERGKEVNAIPFYKTDMLGEDGTYTFLIRRKEDEKLIRGYQVEVKNGEMVPLPETSLQYEPGHSLVVPRVYKLGANVLNFIPAFWIKRPSA